MRAKAFENLLKMFEEAVDNKVDHIHLQNLSTKSKILRKRDSSSESVLRELLNR